MNIEHMKIYESAENYLETIYLLSRQRSDVRSIDIAAETGFTKPSVSRAMKNLRQSGHILMDEKGYITLTPSGQEVAERVYERHELFSKLLRQIGVSEQTAQADACRIEHVISAETFDCIKQFARRLQAAYPDKFGDLCE